MQLSKEAIMTFEEVIISVTNFTETENVINMTFTES